MPEFISLPPGTPEPIKKKIKERSHLAERHSAALSQFADLSRPERDEEAKRADALAAREVVRQGKPASSAGTPHVAKLAEDRRVAEAEVDALASAIAAVDVEIGDQFATLIADPQRSGVVQAAASRAEYERLLDEMLAARSRYFTDTSRAAFNFRAATQRPEGPDGFPLPQPAWLDKEMRRAIKTSPDHRRLGWSEQHLVPNVAINKINGAGNGTRDYDLPPIPAADLIARTLRAELDAETHQ